MPGLRAKPDVDFLFKSRPPQLPFMLHQGMERRTLPVPADAQAVQASLLCGFLGCDRRPFNPLLGTLPRMIHAPASELAGDADDWIAHFARLAAAESERKRPGGEVVLERMSEMMFVDLLRRYLQRLPDDQRGWLLRLRDRYVGRVLGLMHRAPGRSLDDGASGRPCGLVALCAARAVRAVHRVDTDAVPDQLAHADRARAC